MYNPLGMDSYKIYPSANVNNLGIPKVEHLIKKEVSGAAQKGHQTLLCISLNTDNGTL